MAYRAKAWVGAGKAFAFAASGEGESLVVRHIRHNAVRQPGTRHGYRLIGKQPFVPGFKPVRALLRRHSAGRAARPDGIDDCRRGGVAIHAVGNAILQELEPHVRLSFYDEMVILSPAN